MQRNTQRRFKNRAAQSRRGLVSSVDSGFAILLLTASAFMWMLFQFFLKLTKHPECEARPASLFGEAGKIDAIMDFCLAGIFTSFVIVAIWTMYVRAKSKFRFSNVVLLITHLGLLVAMALFWTNVWSIFHPLHPLAPAASHISQPFTKDSVASIASFEWLSEPDVFEGKSEWELKRTGIYWNEKSQLLVQNAVVKSCFPGNEVRQIVRNYVPGGILTDGSNLNEWSDTSLHTFITRFVIYDAEGQYITTQSGWDHHEFEGLLQLDAARASSRDPKQARRDVWESFSDPLTPRPALYEEALLSYEEIYSNVSAAWAKELGPLD